MILLYLAPSDFTEQSVPPLAGGPKSLISRRGLYSLAPCDSAEQNNPVNCFARGGVGTLVEPAKNEPCETACRMAEGESTRVFKITTSLRTSYSILCSVTAPRLKRDSEPADLSCRQPIFSAGCFALCSACFFLVMTCLFICHYERV